jgi:hypothetical protein
MLDCKTAHCGEWRPEHIDNLSCGRHLPVEVSTANFQVEGVQAIPMSGIYIQAKRFLIECENSTAEIEVLCFVHELQKMWDGKDELV